MASSQNRVVLTVGGNSMTATLVDNEATRELIEILSERSITLLMNDYGGFEKVGELPQSLPTSNSQITTVPGDIMLYQGNNMVIFYGSNSWSYTRLGKIDNAEVNELKEFLGTGSVTLTLSLGQPSEIESVSADNQNSVVIYDLKGNRVTKAQFQPGIYIKNGRKRLRKK